MDLGIAGKTAIVCASSRGLGKGCALALAEAGCGLVVNGRDAGVLAATADEIRQRFGVKVTAVAGDVSKPEVQAALIGAAPEADILVNNNAGPPRRGFREIDRAAMLEGIVQNMATPLELIRALIDGMAARGFGRIVNVTSHSVFMPVEGLDLSSGARAGLTAYLAGVSREFAAKNVTINNLLPGRMDTMRLTAAWDAAARRTGKPVAEFAAASRGEIPARRFGTLEEFGQVCAFLCSVQAGYIVGQNILVDGGLFPAAF